MNLRSCHSAAFYLAVMLCGFLGSSSQILAVTIHVKSSTSSSDNAANPVVLSLTETIEKAANNGSASDDKTSHDQSVKHTDGKSDKPPVKGFVNDDVEKWKNEQKAESEDWHREQRKTLNTWKKEHQKTLELWEKEHAAFLNRIPIYKANTFAIEEPKHQTKKGVEKPKQSAKAPVTSKIVNAAFLPPVKDQGNRATCSAFAGIRALEILLAQNNKNSDLSEQYFYWASRPDCQKSACDKKGSWVLTGFDFSKQQGGHDIPDETACPYQNKPLDHNETQLPLPNDCFNKGFLKVSEYKDLASWDDIVDALNHDIPVIGAFRLSENFYKTQGVVTLKEAEAEKQQPTDLHAKAHAILIVGYIKIPDNLSKKEGESCLIAVNSWGVGWGKGGYSCLTRSWFNAFKIPVSFVGVMSADI